MHIDDIRERYNQVESLTHTNPQEAAREEYLLWFDVLDAIANDNLQGPHVTAAQFAAYALFTAGLGKVARIATNEHIEGRCRDVA